MDRPSGTSRRCPARASQTQDRRTLPRASRWNTGTSSGLLSRLTRPPAFRVADHPLHLTNRGRSIRGAASVGGVPDGPRSLAASVHLVERLLVLEGVHRCPEPGVAVGAQLLQPDETLEGLLDELFAFLDVVEDLALEGEEAAVDPDTRIGDVANVAHARVVAERDGVEALTRTDADEAGHRVLTAEILQIRRERKVGQPVAVVGEKRRVVTQV